MANILEAADNIVNHRSEEKERMYGPFDKSMDTMRDIFNAMTGLKLNTEHMFKAMMAMKLAREAHTHREDNLLDLAAYTGALNNYIQRKSAEPVDESCESCEHNTELSHATGLCTQCLLGGGQFRNYTSKPICRPAYEAQTLVVPADTTSVLRVSKVRDVKEPSRGTKGSAGLDFYVPNDDDLRTIHPGSSALIPSGIVADIPQGHALIAFNKSGVATKKNLIIGACVIDEDYMGEIHLHLINAGTDTVVVKPGEKIAQFLLMPINMAEVECVRPGELFDTTTERGANGFGSTGV